MAIRKNAPGSQETSPQAIFAEILPSTPLEGVAFSRHFCTPSEGVGGAHPRCRHQRTIFAESLPSTPLEGVAFSRHFCTPSEGVGDAHPRCRHRRIIFAESLPCTPLSLRCALWSRNFWSIAVMLNSNDEYLSLRLYVTTHSGTQLQSFSGVCCHSSTA